MNETKYICRLCLLIVDDFEALDDNKLQMCTVVLPTIVEVYYKSVICNYCFDSLQQSFDFKTTCLSNEESLNPLLVNGNVKSSLHELIPNNIDVIKQEDHDELLVCRLCFKYFESKLLTDLSRIEDDFFLRDMVENCLPEINLNSTPDAAVCQNCMQLLQNQFNLISTFVDTNDKINAYFSYTDVDIKASELDLFKVLQFIANVKEEKSLSHPVEEIKLEFSYDEPANIDIKLENNLQLDPQSDDNFEEQVPPSNVVKKKPFRINSQGIYLCNFCPHETTLKPSILLHQQKHQPTAQFKCDKCDFTTIWRSSMLNHCWLHREVRPVYQCAVCPYKTRFNKHLRRHSKRHQDPDALPKYQCQYCKYSTSDESYYKTHNRTKHKKEVLLENKSYNCGACDFVTTKKTLLTKHHKEVHRKYICEQCGKKTNTRYHLTQHLLTHKKNTEVIMYDCTKCDFRTKHQRSLKAHSLLH